MTLLDRFSVPARLDNVLVYSLIEILNKPSFKAKRVVYDPQAGKRAELFSSYECDVDSLAIVCNLEEARAMAARIGLKNAKQRTPNALGKAILKHENADAVIVKMGFAGAHVVTAGSGRNNVPAFKGDRVFGIGTGDIYSAVFAAFWAEYGTDVFDAARLASIATGYYCNMAYDLLRTPVIPPDVDALANSLTPANVDRMNDNGTPRSPKNKKVYLAGPFFNLAQIWLVNECHRCLSALGLDVWSPMAEAGILSANADESSIREVVQTDLQSLDKCAAVFALLDGFDAGTLFEVGYAAKKGIPVVALCQNAPVHALTMMEGNDICQVYDDLAIALYTLGWRVYGL